MSNNLFDKVRRVCTLLGSVIFCDDLRLIDVEVSRLHPQKLETKGCWYYAMVTLSYRDHEIYGIAACAPKYFSYLQSAKSVAEIMALSDYLPIFFFFSLVCAVRFCKGYQSSHSDGFLLELKAKNPATKFENALKMMSDNKLVMFY